MNFFSHLLMTVAILGMPASGFGGSICGSKHFPEKILKPIKCDHGSKVIILGENHQDPLAQLIRDHVSALASHKQLFSFSEGWSYIPDKDGRNFGLDDSKIGAITALMVAGPVFEVSIGRSIDSFSADERFAVEMSRKHFLRAFFNLQEVWGDLNWLPDTFKNADGGKILEILMPNRTVNVRLPLDVQMQVSIENSSAWTNFSDFKTLSLAASSLLERGLLLLRNDPAYKFVNFSETNALLGDARNIIFSKAVLENYCRASAGKRNIWIQIGKGHANGVQCLLKQFLPKNADIQIRSAKDYESIYESWQNEFKEKVGFQLQTDIQKVELDSKVDMYSSDNSSMPKWAIQYHSTSALKKSSLNEIKTRIENAGYTLTRSFPNSIWVTFKPDQN